MKNLISSIKYMWLLSGLLLTTKTFAQNDTVQLSLQDAEKQFLQKNLALIAGKYNIDINKALVKQAKLWDNPTFSVSTNVYDDSKYPFYHGSSNTGGEVDLQWQQLFKIGGQRKKLASVLSDNALLAEAQFNELMDELRYTLHNDFYQLAALLQYRSIYDYEINELMPLVSGMDKQFQAGNISAKDNVRMKALLFDLQSDVLGNEKQVTEVEAELRELLHEERFILPDADLSKVPDIRFSDIVPDSLLSLAKSNRPDYKAALVQSQIQQHNLSYQKSLAVPDMALGVEYDKHNSYAPNYVGLGLSMQLPLFNRNQVNVQVARLGIEQQKAQNEVLEGTIRSDIYEALEKLKLAYTMHNSDHADFSGKYDALLSKMLDSYKQKQINLVELIDFLDAYTDTRQKLIQQATDIQTSIEALNYACGTKIIQN